VVFWSRHCGPALEQLPDIIRLSAALEARGARLVLVTEEQRSPDLTRFLAERAPGLELYHDQWRDATIAFQSWGTPQYFVVDSDGRLRFEYSELDDVLRQLEAVSPPVRSASSAVEPEARGAQRMANGDASQLARRSAGSS